MDMGDESLNLCIRDERYSDRSNSHGTTNDTRSVGGYCEPPSQSAVFYNFPNVHQTQRQFAAPNSFPNAFDNITNAYQSRWQFVAYHDISNAFEPQDEIVAPYNNPTVFQPLGQIAAPGNCTNASEPQSLSDSDISDILQQFLNDYQPQLQDGAPNGFPNDNQPQRQFDALYDISNDFEQQSNEIVAPYNNPSVYHPLGQIAASANCPNVSEPQSLTDALDILQQLDDIPNSANSPKFFDRQRLRHLRQLYGPVFDDCNEVRRNIKEYIFKISSNEATFARAINVHPKSLYRFLRQQRSNRGAGSIVYPAAYYYFEEMRIDHHEGKSRHRLDREKHCPNGYDLARISFNMPRKF
ncbi:hypothetical protein Bhyg_12749 [Pseudolycoriella hygida]|uniref:DUF7726 domain-containing protein n=1 Tax=Pseudolycoriella hygida TaxID=35572 RepID=A0A9Q0MY29_9DIPT|nr:hypothetical protein Bhyg_12749 [Pseudolycoriella hygida]